MNELIVLIAEDDEVNFKYIEKLLSGLKGIITLRAANGRDAVDIAINNKNVALVLMDIKMPLLDGYSATKMIKEARPDLPIIAVTAFAMQQDRIAALSAGCDDYLSKPFEAENILNVIKFHLELIEDTN
ncbi:MAG: response regulator [Candidatus Kapabacteria bacterium]|nr:response regulator [Candidatus Kapabacteria bacterium]